MDAAKLHELDEQLVRLRGSLRRPTYRRHVLEGIEVAGGLTTIRVLRAIERSPSESSISIRQLAEQLAIQQSTASRAVDTAVRAGLVERTTCSADQRRVLLATSALGRDVLSLASVKRQEVLGHVVRDWSENDLSTVLVLLGRLNDDFDQVWSDV